MCGIVGVVGRAVPTRAQADAARDSLRHRGPDGAGTLWEPDLFLGHRRLAIQDLSEAGAQPMVSACGRWVIVYNGELYNAPALRRRLEGDGLRLRSSSDTEVVLETLARRGEEALRGFNGIFALALWDRRERRLMLARDHLGVKPLYLAPRGPGLAFASELGALRCLDPALDLTPDPRRIVQMLSFGWIPEPHTAFPGVRKLPPGHVLTWHEGRSRVAPYWDLLWEPCGTRSDPEDDLVEEARERLDQAVARQLLSDVPVGAFLSGGLDSSCIVSRMAPRMEVNAYTIRPTGEATEGFADDARYARQVADHLGVRLHPLEATPDLVDEVPRAVAHCGDPIADPAAISTWEICRLARQHGSVVVLSGQGGDELFGGYLRHLALLRTRLPLGVERGLACLPWQPRGALGALTRPLRRLHKVTRTLGDPVGRRYARQSTFCADPTEVAPLLSADWRDRTRGFDVFDDHLQAWRDAGPRDVLSRALYTDIRTFLPSHNLHYSDRMSMAASVELRVPFLDPDLVRFAWSVPASLKIRRFTTKYLLKRAAEAWLPREVIHRPKRGFGAPVRDWMRGPLAPITADVLCARAVRDRGAFDPVAVAGALDDHVAGRRDHGYLLYAMLVYELWCQGLEQGRAPS